MRVTLQQFEGVPFSTGVLVVNGQKTGIRWTRMASGAIYVWLADKPEPPVRCHDLAAVHALAEVIHA